MKEQDNKERAAQTKKDLKDIVKDIKEIQPDLKSYDKGTSAAQHI